MIIILHGWSDDSRSFRRLAHGLSRLGLAGPVRPIYLGDYVSMDDDVSFDDLAEAMQRAWAAAGLPRAARSVDLLVHSTGALVARHWMTRYCTPLNNPIHRLLMLAPANFGSPLAHKGTSFLGRAVKGFKSRRLFHTGKRILHGLELASPFTWELAERDRFDPHNTWYGPGHVLATVLVGTAGYRGIAAAANSAGSDGTVLVSSAQLNPLRIDFDFASDPQAPQRRLLAAFGSTAFCRVPQDNHSTLAYKDGGPKNPRLDELVRAALTVDDAGFAAHSARLSQLNAEFRRQEGDDNDSQGYQNTVLRVRDDHGRAVDDYFLEAFAKRINSDHEDTALTTRIQSEVLAGVHPHSQAPSYRSLKFNCDALLRLLIDPSSLRMRPLQVSITASPEIKDTGSVGYATVGYRDIGSIRIEPDELGRVFQADRTVLISLTIKRQQVDSLVRFVRQD